MAKTRKPIGFIRGPRGADGTNGTNGKDLEFNWHNDGDKLGVRKEGDTNYTYSQSLEGPQGATFTPTVANDGTLSWSNDGGLTNPPNVNIKGQQGPTGNVVISTVTVSSYNDLPSINDSNTPDPSTLYLVLTRSTDSNHDKYDEYIWNSTDNAYEKIGSGDLGTSLTNYYTKSEIDALIGAISNVITS